MHESTGAETGSDKNETNTGQAAVSTGAWHNILTCDDWKESPIL